MVNPLRDPFLIRAMPTALRTAIDAGWAPTSTAAYFLGVSPDSLRRYARSGYFQPGEHYRPGVRSNSPWVWRLEACAEELLHLSTQREQAQQLIEEQPPA